MKQIAGKILLIAFIICNSSAVKIVAQGVEFRSITYEEALKAATKEKKMVFLHGYAEWCHYCHDMVEKIYPDSAVGAFFNANFISIKLDLEKEGSELNKRLLSHTFPTLVFFDSSGTIMHRAAGRHMKPMIIQLGKDALEPRIRLHTWERLFNNGICSGDTAYRYLKKMEMTGTNYQPQALKYLNRLNNEETKSALNWKIIHELYKDVNAEFTTKLIELKPELEQLYTKIIVDKKFFDMYNFEFSIRTRTLDSAGFEKLKQRLNNSKLDIAVKISDYADLNKAKMKSDYVLYYKLAEPFLNNHAADDAILLNEIAHLFYEKTKDPVLLSKAEQWSRKSVTINDTYAYNETLAGILILSGKKEEARKVTTHAIEVGKQNKNNTKKAEIFLEKIEEMP